MSDPMGLPDKRLVTLAGGVLDGHMLEASDNQNELTPLPHHYREHGWKPRSDSYRRNSLTTFVINTQESSSDE